MMSIFLYPHRKYSLYYNNNKKLRFMYSSHEFVYANHVIFLYINWCLVCFSITRCPTALTLKCTNRWVSSRSLALNVSHLLSRPSFLIHLKLLLLSPPPFFGPQLAPLKVTYILQESLYPFLSFSSCLFTTVVSVSLWWTSIAALCCGGVNGIHKHN